MAYDKAANDVKPGDKLVLRGSTVTVKAVRPSRWNARLDVEIEHTSGIHVTRRFESVRAVRAA